MEPVDLEAIALRAARHAGRAPGLVLPVRPIGRADVFLCAFAPDDDGAAHRWLLVDADGTPSDDPADVRRAVEIAAMCEAAEESSGLAAAAEAMALLAAARPAAEAVGDADALLAVDELHAALAALAAETPPDAPRVAEPAYVDRLAVRAALVGDRFDLLREAAMRATARLGDPGDRGAERLAERLWDVIRVLVRDGAPDRFAQQMESAIGAAAALAEDVQRHYLLPLRGADDEEGDP